MKLSDCHKIVCYWSPPASILGATYIATLGVYRKIIIVLRMRNEDTVLEHVLASHHEDLHLPNSLFNSSDLLTMISNLNSEILSKFKRMYHT